DLNTAVTTVSYKVGPTTFTREVFASPVDQVMVIKIAANTPHVLNFSASFETPQKATVSTEGNNALVLRGVNGDAFGIKGGLNFEAVAEVVAPGGESVAENQKIVIRNADSAVILVAIATSYINYKNTNGNPRAIAPNHLVAARRKTFEQLRADHVREHQRLFHRVKLNLGRTAATDLPTDQRPAQFLQGLDPHLATLYFQYGRYLLISSSRPGTQPANLQGIWNNL